MLGYKGDILPSSRSLSKRGMFPLATSFPGSLFSGSIVVDKKISSVYLTIEESKRSKEPMLYSHKSGQPKNNLFYERLTFTKKLISLAAKVASTEHTLT